MERIAASSIDVEPARVRRNGKSPQTLDPLMFTGANFGPASAMRTAGTFLVREGKAIGMPSSDVIAEAAR